MTYGVTMEEKKLHLVGVGVGHSIAPAMHNYIANSLGLPWTFYTTECETIGEAVSVARSQDTAGLVVTMPYKNAIMSKLDIIDKLAASIGACNNVYRDAKNPDRLHGTNTDWLGIKGCLLEQSDPQGPKLHDPALIVGAGGASRAAVYALNSYFQSSEIYILNRDDDEVADLILDSQRLYPRPRIIHVKSVEEARNLKTPTYVVGSVPDIEPKTAQELEIRGSLEEFLSRTKKGVLLDMCFKPRQTRTIKLAKQSGWQTVEGTHVIGYQIEEQWRLWAGEEKVSRLDKAGAWKILLETADQSPGINF